MRTRLFFTLALLFALAPAASAGGPRMLVGAVEDGAKESDMFGAKEKMDLARLAGFTAVRLTAIWDPGQTAPTGREFTELKNATVAARLVGIRPIVAVRHPGARTTPLTNTGRGQFARYAAAIARSMPVTDIIVGNEPNLNRFWMPQFTRAGKDSAAPAYLQLLARTYDALKAVSPRINVIGGAVSPRGEDKPRSTRPTHSPTVFIRDLGQAYRKSKRKKPIMDTFAIHGYQEKSSISPGVRHPRATTITVSDYGKLVALLGKTFKGTKQRGARLPILYGEFGVQSQIPAGKRPVYTNLNAPGAGDAVDETLQGVYYRQALRLSYCQKNVMGMLIFHVSDEPDLGRWQSGIYYADDTPKTNFAVVRDTIASMRAGRVLCPSALGGHAAATKPTRGHRGTTVPLSEHASRASESHLARGGVELPHICRSVRSDCGAAVPRVHLLRR